MKYTKGWTFWFGDLLAGFKASFRLIQPDDVKKNNFCVTTRALLTALVWHHANVFRPQAPAAAAVGPPGLQVREHHGCRKPWGWNRGVARDLLAVLAVLVWTRRSLFLQLNHFFMKLLKVRQISPCKWRMWCVFGVCVRVYASLAHQQIVVSKQM